MAQNNTKKKTTAASNKSAKQSTNRSQPQKKPAPRQEPAVQKKEMDSVGRQKAGIIVFGVAVLFLFLAFLEGESVWQWCHNALFKVFGFCAYIVPVLLIYVAIVCSKEKTMSSLAANLTGSGVIILLISSLIHVFSKTAEYLDETSFGNQVSDAVASAEIVKRGGFFGAVIGGLFSKLAGKTGAVVILMILLIVAVLLVTGISLPVLAGMIKKPVVKAGEATNQRFKDNAKRREEQKEQELIEKAAREAYEAELEKQREQEEALSQRRKTPPVVTTGDTVSGKGKKLPDRISKVSDGLIEPPMPSTGVNGPSGKKAPPTVAGINTAAGDALNAGVKSADTAVKTTEAVSKKAQEEAARAAAEDARRKAQELLAKKKAAQAKEEKNDSASTPSVKKEYEYPSVDCLNYPDNSGAVDSVAEIQLGANKLIETLESFHINAEVTNICRGPSVTRYELVPEAGVRISKITSLSDDIALRLAAKSVRIEAPIPGKAAIGIEVPNKAKSMVSMREIIDSDQYRIGSRKSKLSVAVGKDITGNVICADIAKMPHLLVAGTTGSGKSVCLNAMIISILYNASPDEVKLLMIDPKMVEFTVYNGIAHLEVPVVSNPKKAAGALGWAVGEMEKRYLKFSENGVRDMASYNKLAAVRTDLEKMHHIVIFIDELSDLMMTSPKEVEDAICRLAQMARAAGIHLVIATQRPSTDVITGLIKANIPARLSLLVSNSVDSRIILDAGGAEKLLGNGDMLFAPTGGGKPTRIQGCYISDEEIEKVVSHIKRQMDAEYDDEIIKEIDAKAAENSKSSDDDGDVEDLDPMFNQAAETVIIAGQASTTMLQKKLKLGYARASRVMDQLEEKGIVGPSEGAKPRSVLMSKQQWYESQALSSSSGNNDSDSNLYSMFGEEDVVADSPEDSDLEADEELFDEDFLTEEETEEELTEVEETVIDEEPEPESSEEIFEEDVQDDTAVYDETEDEDNLDIPVITVEEIPDEEEPEEAQEDEYSDEDEPEELEYIPIDPDPYEEKEYEDVYSDSEFYDESSEFDEDEDLEDRPVSIDSIFDDDDDFAGKDDNY